MPRRPTVNEAINEAIGQVGTTTITYTFPIHPVKEHLKNKYFEYLKKDPSSCLECPICYEVIDCRNCFTLLTCSHFLHRHCWDAIVNNRCPLCNTN